MAILYNFFIYLGLVQEKIAKDDMVRGTMCFPPKKKRRLKKKEIKLH